MAAVGLPSPPAGLRHVVPAAALTTARHPQRTCSCGATATVGWGTLKHGEKNDGKETTSKKAW